jgi:hypothetical protein
MQTVVTVVRAVLTEKPSWHGTATELLHTLAPTNVALPGNARVMATVLRTAAPLLREGGIEVGFVRTGHAGTRIIRLALTQACGASTDTTAPVAADALTQTTDARAVSLHADARQAPAVPTQSSDPAPAADADASRASEAALTFEQQITRWLDQHPEPSEPGWCAYCGESETRARSVVPFGTKPGTHAWLHSNCWRAWHGQRRFKAVTALGGSLSAV